MSTLAYAYESGYQDGLKAAGTEKQEYERRIDELCQENEQLRQQNAKLRELLSESLMDYKLYAEKYGLPPYISDVNEHLDARMCELGIEVPA